MSLKTRGSEKVPCSKSSCSRLIFSKQLIKYSLLNNHLQWYQRKKNSHSITVRSCCHTHLILFILEVSRSAHLSSISRCLLKNESVTLCLTEFYFQRTVCKQKNIWRNLAVSQYFRPVFKMGAKPGRTLVIVK